MSEVANTEKLIELVRERSLLYDLSDVDYKNRDKKAEAWLQIATALGFGDSKLWIAKWKSLRDSYGKFKKNNESSTGQSYKKYKTWPWASQMRFLDDYNVRRPTESNSQPSQATIDTTFHTDTNITDDSSVDMTLSDATPGPSKPFSRKRIRTSEDSSDKILDGSQWARTPKCVPKQRHATYGKTRSSGVQRSGRHGAPARSGKRARRADPRLSAVMQPACSSVRHDQQRSYGAPSRQAS
ncbi:uncharacterized protein LOC125240444 [Leguminivora glycinivorella]|uniref:uncharacterized protein LOC125240444 n=1 Tax=Leguminivora glycinivorella TaxID=1035111 RepID=UPI00201008EA|nr:uncharacterized protein LOC125240444 [Leguminivora glycinivorella]